MIASLACLCECKIIAEEEARERREMIDALIAEMKLDLKTNRPSGIRPVGRPKPAQDKKCRHPGCSKPAANGYCSREHAPLAFYGQPAPAHMGNE